MRRFAFLLCAIAAAAPGWTAELRLITAELPPYTFQVPPATVSEFPGPGQGLVQEVVEEMARRVGHSGTIEYMPWARAQQIAMTEPNVGILSLTRSPEREDKYRWLAKIVTDDLVLVGGQGVDVSSLDKVKSRPTGVLLRSGAEALLREKGFTRVEPAPEEWLNAKKLKERRIDAWLAPRLMVIYAMQEVQGDLGTLYIRRDRARERYLSRRVEEPSRRGSRQMGKGVRIDEGRWQLRSHRSEVSAAQGGARRRRGAQGAQRSRLDQLRSRGTFLRRPGMQ